MERERKEERRYREGRRKCDDTQANCFTKMWRSKIKLEDSTGGIDWGGGGARRREGSRQVSLPVSSRLRNVLKILKP